MFSQSKSNTIYVGNIQSIKDEQLREYFEQFGKVEDLYHNCKNANDEWLIDYRFIRFSSDTDLNLILTNKVDHMICRIVLDIHRYDEVFHDQTRLISDKKICIAHTNPNLNRNAIKKSFGKYGRILNCTCVSSGNGVEYVYIEFDSINAISSIFQKNQRHLVGQTSLAVQKPIRPSKIQPKIESMNFKEKDFYDKSITKNSPREKINSHVDKAQYSNNIRKERQISNKLKDLSEFSHQSSNSNNSFQTLNQKQIEFYEREYNLNIRKDFDEIKYSMDKFLKSQCRSYKKIRQYLLDELRNGSSSSSDENDEIESISSTSDSENIRDQQKKHFKSCH